jgi:Arc/MetJ family transcription regulator
MKTTVDIDERKLRNVMRLAGARTRKAAVDYALECTERMEKLRRVLEHPLPDEEYRGAVAEEYNLSDLREKDTPGRRHVDD